MLLSLIVISALLTTRSFSTNFQCHIDRNHSPAPQFQFNVLDSTNDDEASDDEFFSDRAANFLAEEANSTLRHNCTCASLCNNLVAQNDNRIMQCLDTCGFAIVADAYDPRFLDEMRASFNDWMSEPEDVWQFRSQYGGGIRGLQRFEAGLPDLDEFRYEDAIFNLNVAPIAIRWIKLFQSSLEEKWEKENCDESEDSCFPPSFEPTVDFISFIHNIAGSNTQGWHTDSRYPAALKVQVPLVDVDRMMGPVEVVAKGESDTCRFHAGIVKKGTAIMYVHSLAHRGTANLSGKNRTVLDYSYMTRADMYEYNYLAEYSIRAQSAMMLHREKFEELKNLYFSKRQVDDEGD